MPPIRIRNALDTGSVVMFEQAFDHVRRGVVIEIIGQIPETQFIPHLRGRGRIKGVCKKWKTDLIMAPALANYQANVLSKRVFDWQ